jgi:hypothetical protein
VHHSERRHVWSAGNIWALDQPLNLRASDELPREKFAWLDSLPDDQFPHVWPSERFLLDDERARLVEAEAALCATPPRVEEGMRAFRAFARGRTLRILDAVTREIPDLPSFAPSSDARAGDPVERPIGDVGRAMGIETDATQVVRLPPESGREGALLSQIRVLVAEATALGCGDAVPSSFRRDLARDDRLQAIVERANAVGVGAEFVSIVQAARESGLHARPYTAAVMFTLPRDKRRMVFTIAPFEDRITGAFRIERDAAQAARLLGVSEAAARDALGPDGPGVIDRLDVLDFVERLRCLLAVSPVVRREHRAEGV